MRILGPFNKKDESLCTLGNMFSHKSPCFIRNNGSEKLPRSTTNGQGDGDSPVEIICLCLSSVNLLGVEVSGNSQKSLPLMLKGLTISVLVRPPLSGTRSQKRTCSATQGFSRGLYSIWWLWPISGDSLRSLNSTDGSMPWIPYHERSKDLWGTEGTLSRIL